eukprot:14758826-Alexandrium_andersonii.AAC.1
MVGRAVVLWKTLPAPAVCQRRPDLQEPPFPRPSATQPGTGGGRTTDAEWKRPRWPPDQGWAPRIHDRRG